MSVFAVLASLLAAPSMAAASDERPRPEPQKIAADLDFAESPTQDFWVQLTARADLTAYRSTSDWALRGTQVAAGLREFADTSQASVRALLVERGADFESYWITNAIRVHGGTSSLASELSAFSVVGSIFGPVEYETPKPFKGVEQARPDIVEWGIDNINADDVWDQFGVRGEGITVANVDTGVQYDHPALVGQYRGNLGDGTFDHNYNWYDAWGAGDVPVDFDGHGTHTMGTMVGDDGGTNQIGVAPGANWIAANGCCPTDQALLDSMQWMLEPTDLNGDNPDASKRPHIINNSWGTVVPSNDPFGEDIQQAWNDSGIFGMWSNGNSGPSCNTSGSPGSRTINYSAGAYDITNSIADFSARGPGQDGEIKPNISAPGVDVRSSYTGGTYIALSGTSMASPHTAGAVALAWSAAPALLGDVAGTRALLDDIAIDVEDTSCGGDADDNNVWGEGRLDALALLEAAPIGDTGTLAGTVTAADTGDPIQGATVSVTGPLERTTFTDENGDYSLLVSTGTYDVTASAFGYEPETQTAEITTDDTTTVDFVLATAEVYRVHGKVRDKANLEPIEGATVTILGTPLVDTTNKKGKYEFEAVPVGTYDMTAEGGNCLESKTKTVTVDGEEKVKFKLAPLTDEFGYSCTEEPSAYVEGDTLLPDLVFDDTSTSVELPFPFAFYGQTYTTAYVNTNGHLNFLDNIAFFVNESIPSPNIPNALVAPYWDDLYVEVDSAVYTATSGDAPDRTFTVEWRNVAHLSDFTKRVDISLTLHENGEIVMAYRNLDPASDLELGNSATVGIENESGTVGLEYSENEAALSDDTQIHFTQAPNGFVTGTVTDGNDGLGIAGATVTATDEDGDVVRETTTDADGTYTMQLPLGTYTVEASKGNYTSDSTTVTIDEDGETVTADFVLDTAVADVEPASFEFILEPGMQRSADLTITNTGTEGLTWEISEVDLGSGRVPAQRPAGPTAGPEGRDDGFDAGALTTKGMYTPDQEAAAAAVPQAPGDVLAEWPAEGMDLPWGVGYAGDVWVSDPILIFNKEFTTDGTPTGVEHDTPWAEVWPADMARDISSGAMCQVEVANVGGDIVCWDEASGEVLYSISAPSEPWGAISQRGLGYNPVDDTFYIGGWNEGVVYTVAGSSHPTPGATLNECSTEDPSISGLAYNSTSGTLWVATNSPTDTIFQVTPSDCATISTIDNGGDNQYSGAGIELDAQGNIWAADQAEGVLRLLESGVPASSDVPWLSVDPTAGETAPGESDTVTVTVDTTGLEAGLTYEATLIVSTNAGRVPNVQVPVQLVVPAYLAAVNVGGDEYTESDGDEWLADQAYVSGEWGWIGQRADVETTTEAIGGTDDDPLFQDRRSGIFSYQFDEVPAGTYEVVLGFAEFSESYLPGHRIFDVSVNGDYELFAHDVAAEVGGLYADIHTLTIEHGGGALTVALQNRPLYDMPILNAVSVTERSDM